LKNRTNLQPATCNLQLPLFNLQLPLFNLQLPLFNLQPATSSLQLLHLPFGSESRPSAPVGQDGDVAVKRRDASDETSTMRFFRPSPLKKELWSNFT